MKAVNCKTQKGEMDMKHTKLIAAALSATVMLSAVPVTAFAADNGADNIYEDADCTITFTT